MAARVWQRVQNTQEPGDLSAEILLLLAEEAEDAALYRRFAKHTSKEKTVLLETIMRSNQQCTATLRGLYYLLTGSYPKAVPASPAVSTNILQHCYGSALRRSIRYGQWCSHSEYGCAFQQLETLSRQRCLLLLQLAGTS